jgi:hypothetical protein
MTADSPTASVERRLGVVATTALGLVLLGWALTVDFPKATGGGFFSDGATYYSLTHSLAEDGDFAFTREDLQRVWREFATGPEGIFLKRGRDVQGIAVASSPPYLQIISAPDPDQTRLYYGKSFAFSLFAAPFVWLFGTNGFLVFHAVLMTLCFACAYAFLVERSAPLVAAVFAAAFLFASVAPVYMAWLTPDFFNLATVLVAYFFWTYKEAAAHETLAGGRIRRRLLTGITSDVLAAVCLGLATFSKPTHVLLMLPILALLALRRQWLRGLIVGSVFAAVTLGFFAWNAAISGEWNYQGGEERSTFYSRDPDAAGPRLGGFRFNPTSRPSTRPASRARPIACSSKSSPAVTQSGTSSAATWATSSSAATRGSCRTSSLARSPSCCCCWRRGEARRGSGSRSPAGSGPRSS